MDLIGAVILGFFIGMIVCYKIIKAIANKNKQHFINKMANIKARPINNDEMIIDAIGGGLDQLMHLHGQKVKIEKQYYIMCWIDNKHFALPMNCLISKDD